MVELHSMKGDGMRFFLAIRAFFLTLFSRAAAERVERALRDDLPAEPAVVEEKKPTPSAPSKPARSEALTLLAALQREARFVDFVQEPLAEYSDDQIGAAARDVHRLCGEVLKRMFDLRPLVPEAEGASVEVPPGFDGARYRLVGNVAGSPPFRGQLAHHGWEAAKCDVPVWSGGNEAALVVAPAEVEVKG
jgi:hypothetical protein